GLLAEYEGEVQVHVLMLRTQQHRNTIAPARTPREIFLWDAIMAHWIACYESELEWVRQLRQDLSHQP
ncbi:MAG: DUF4180 domain-containing protein, partial [Chloroflexi bacterium]|nr:DUF4180 domain-containing protein [Chloroflexota bacterium]